MKKNIAITVIGIFLTLIIMSLRPIAISKDNSVKLMGAIDTAYLLKNTNDLVLKISGDKRTFYINRATERNLNVQQLIEKLHSQTVSILYADHWTLLDPFGSKRHITQLTVGQEQIFTELD